MLFGKSPTAAPGGGLSARAATACIALVLLFAPQAPAQETVLDPGRAEELLDLREELSGAEQARARAEARARAAERAVVRLQEELVAAGVRAQALEEALIEADEHLAGLVAARAVSEAMLAERRAQLIESLAALQRLDLEPPPALLVKPQDALEAARGAMLLGTLVPELRAMATELASQIRSLDDLARAIAAQRDRIEADRLALDAERRRIDELLVAREEERRISGADAELARARYDDLAGRARTLRDLLGGLEEDVPTAAIVPPGGDGPRTAPVFADLRGRLRPPVVGRIVGGFGSDDGSGGASQGVSVAAPGRAEVVSPADAEIVFAGPFRTYGNVLIIAPGDSYLIVLAGLADVYGVPGQRILTGEPVGRMPESGANEQSGPSGGDAAAAPVLYIEVREDGSPVDPASWIRFRQRPA